jgi:hypothetical protein
MKPIFVHALAASVIGEHALVGSHALSSRK